MPRLALHIHLAFVCLLVLFATLAVLGWWFRPPEPEVEPLRAAFAAATAELVDDGDDPLARIARLLERSDIEDVQLTLLTSEGEVLASVGDPLPWPGAQAAQRGFTHQRGVGHLYVMVLPDGRQLVARSDRTFPGGMAWLGAIGVLVAALAAAAYPLARRITRRLEHLRDQVDALGEGDLTARVRVEGRDEVAQLASHLNRAAERIERLVGTQRQALAQASHELRSPLARLRMGVELLPDDTRPELRDRMTRDIAELDALIGDVLLASRLEAGASTGPSEPVDLLALVAEEAARCGGQVDGDPTEILGDPRTLRRLVRNLFENAARHGGHAPPEASVRPNGEGGGLLRVCDRGPGVPEAERERIFEPFYRPPGAREGDGGAGLGLSLVRQIARQHGGDVRHQVRDGGGSCFDVVLPAD